MTGDVALLNASRARTERRGLARPVSVLPSRWDSPAAFGYHRSNHMQRRRQRIAQDTVTVRGRGKERVRSCRAGG